MDANTSSMTPAPTHGSVTVADRLELHELNARYGDLIDHQDWAGLEAIFTRDAEFRIVTPARRRSLHGLDEIKWYMAREAQHPIAHHITNVYVDDRNESVRLHTRLLLVQPDRSAESGEYDDEVVRTAAGWRITARVYRFHGPTRQTPEDQGGLERDA